MRVGTLIAVAVTLVGCQPVKPIPTVRFSKPGATNEQFQKDRFECIQASQIRVSGASYNAYGGASASNVRVDRGTIISCLAARGYVADPQGEFAPPPGGQVMLVN
jgi:hypothetical protein